MITSIESVGTISPKRYHFRVVYNSKLYHMFYNGDAGVRVHNGPYVRGDDESQMWKEFWLSGLNTYSDQIRD